MTFVSDCHVRAAADLISHTWDPVVVSALRPGPTRRGVLLERIAGVSDKALTESLRRLVAHGLVARAPGGAAVYELTPLGASFARGPLAHLATWAVEHQDELAAM
ncbi:winged helix-turn-helix transcriptional regulator [Actinomadura parmotrematis]|uniref:winged helix-turn-helix transcriptional regulator n=1 Tax=Actinomadura parmotrematis TaxID=2864039 RepID=UPI0027E3A07F|nr:helix-turn-helix domain-containing protein [Actinomadura parmotrematis]